MTLIKKILVGILKILLCSIVFVVWTKFIGSFAVNLQNISLIHKGLYIGIFLSVPACVVYGMFMLNKHSVKKWLLIFLLGVPMCLVLGVLIFLANDPSVSPFINVLAWLLIIIIGYVMFGGGGYFF